MNKKILLAEALLALCIVLGFKTALRDDRAGKTIPPSAPVLNAVNCSPDWNSIDADSLGAGMTPLPGWGNYSWQINSTSDSAQYYFNQGINMYYAFHLVEAMGSFNKAQSFDDQNPMIYWAQALAYGPNINDFVYEAAADALSAASKAMDLSSTATAKQKALLAAMLVRYSADSTFSRLSLNEKYAAAMKKVYEAFKSDADIASLYADALMLLHPWRYWQHNGAPQPWTNEIVAILEKTLQQHPNHPGANHYYIHMLEASPDPGRAIPSADRLGTMMPSVAHMVHMPSHIYIRTGNYQKGVKVNERSVTGYNQYLQRYPAVAGNAFLYLNHNLHMKATCAMMLPNYGKSILAAKEAANSFDSAYLSLPQPLGNYLQYFYLTPQLVNVRYGKWEAALAMPELSSNYKMAYLLNKWAKGMAYANTGKLVAAKTELKLLNEVLTHPDLQIRMEPFNTPFEQATVAKKLLEGMIAQQENKLPEAIAFYTEAVAAEDKLIYNEPRDWLIPSRHWLANALIAGGELSKATKVLQEDLAINPKNFYALAGMDAINRKSGNSPQEKLNRKALKEAFQGSDMRAAQLVY